MKNLFSWQKIKNSFIAKELMALEAVAQISGATAAFSLALAEFLIGNRVMLLIAGLSLLLILPSYLRVQHALEKL